MASCKDCGAKLSLFGGVDGRCQQCHIAELSRENLARKGVDPAIIQEKRIEDNLQKAQEAQALEGKIAHMTITTEPSLPNVSQRLGIVTAEVVAGTGFLKDLGQSVRSAVGGRGQGYQKSLREMREQAFKDLKIDAHELGADAIVAIDLDYSEISGSGLQMLFLVVSGTAVKLEAPSGKQRKTVAALP